MDVTNLRELTLHNVGQWPLRIKFGVLFGTSCLIIGLGYRLIIQQDMIHYKALKKQEIILKSDFEHKQRQLYHLPSYRAQIKILAEQYVLVLTQLSEKNEMADLLDEISKIGVASGLRFELFAPQQHVVRDCYVEFPIKISAVGTYNQLTKFISRIGEMERIVTFHDFTVTGVPSKEHKVGSHDALVMNVIAKTYQYRT